MRVVTFCIVTTEGGKIHETIHFSGSFREVAVWLISKILHAPNHSPEKHTDVQSWYYISEGCVEH